MAEGSDNESSHREKDRKSSRKDRSDRDRSDRDRSEKKSSRRERKDDDKDRKSSRRRSRSYSPRYRSSRRSRSRSYERRDSRRDSSRRSRRSSSRSNDRSRRSSRRSRSRSDERHRRSPSAEAAKPAAVVSAPATDDLNAIPPVDSAPPSNQPTITQMMLQYPSLSIQEIMAKMSQSQSTMSSVVSLKPMRELYVGNLPPNVTATQLQDFLGTIIQQVGLALQGQPGNPILSTWISTDGMYAFCEMRTVEECNLALMLNQLNLLGRQLKFGRPRSFVGPPQPMPVVSNRTQTALVNLGCIPNPMWFAGGSAACGLKDPNAIRDSHVYLDPAHIPPDNTSNRLLMVNIPTVLTEDQVVQLVEPFGKLDAFTLVKNAEGVSVGSALFEYEDNNVTEEAMNGLNGLDLGGHVLSVQRASKQGVLPKYKPKGEDSAKATVTPTQVIVLGNMVQPAELEDDDEFADLKEDIEEECNKFGKVVALEVPRPKTGETILGVGKVFVRFESVEGAEKATKALTGRKFGGNIVQVEYMSLAKFETQDFA
ncbi:hypothetical protein, variant 3 [Aphanomyces invadans]|uniref:RRM domain-containing protein n=1 Tax=Aphanomyces invadans TaxID=157072 RepID=A0A024TKE3_9STRA|nr:hypothetical protein, variant 2 [Aphanomyces invadans]XP_008876819.1 hypothetical protein H310_11816 [Aphanomyces invadans]XP_008876820.1 hypothetical protein, variant 3 [Aphanomyces invadans]XP_008876821.1 hypothetical protein, variant 1 [Aphanomyces invadans]ETV94503.1 hypothetical protein H310_11816 [Aphanomyces invadans]ETV94504.1 hypothetical protein, variant 1 [Aphanomyces invadans]ETV94505.1 hypothetical protein, variant 2 [Aphanomyces invadans]ETV94506.1 hypothetical protein, vari|eukprot:XP_008876818.1 hypothetical protein, variant 2 [Aphanomyces invadans]